MRISVVISSREVSVNQGTDFFGQRRDMVFQQAARHLNTGRFWCDRYSAFSRLAVQDLCVYALFFPGIFYLPKAKAVSGGKLPQAAYCLP